MSAQAQRKTVTPFPEAIKNLSAKTLVVGDLARWEAEGRMSTPPTDFEFVEIKSLTAEVVDQVDPDIILSPLVADDFDAVDVAAKLRDLQFDGKYRAISDVLPDADLIRKEIRAFAPQLDFDLLPVPANV
ncbi:hypothetical protein [Yoonia sp. BS5-3]|uniref:Uncharacterized protein n=1 Tax=Yoonia phaeophyticola TaxID=3137369 RepID=A0ABZ2V1M7_9RHOB